MSTPRRLLTRLFCFGPLAAAVAYLALLAFPGVLFAHHATFGPFHVASDRPIDPALSAVLIRSSAKLGRSPLYDASVEHWLYIANSPWRRWLLAPTSHGAFGTTSPLWRNTVLNRADAAADLVFGGAPRHNRRSLSGVIAHERMHALLIERYGLFAYCMLPTWKTEGYCDHVAAESSFDPEEGRRLIGAGREEGSHSFRYFRSRLMVRYLLELEGLTPDQLFAREFDAAVLLAKVRGAVNRFWF